MNSQLEIKLAPTPESDAMEYYDAMCDPCRVVEANFARKLERERDDIRAQLREEQQLHVQTLNERDEARGTCSELVTDSDAITLARTVVRITQDRDEARGQRDRLAAVLQRIRDGYGGQVAAPDCCEDCEFLIPIDEALQSLNQPTEL